MGCLASGPDRRRSLFVSFNAQYAYVFHVRRQDAASVIEALLLDLLMIVFTLLALGLARAGQVQPYRAGADPRVRIASAWMNVSAADTARRAVSSPTRSRRWRSPWSWTGLSP